MRIMFPLISNIMELRQARMILNDVNLAVTDVPAARRQEAPREILGARADLLRDEIRRGLRRL